MIYFEVRGFRHMKYGRRRYREVDGLVLSSFRPVKVLLSDYLDLTLRKNKYPPKYVVFKSSGNSRVVLVDSDINRICSVYDVRCLKKETGKKSTIPYRVLMRIYTLKTNLTPWIDVPSYLVSTETLLIALYWIRSLWGENLGMRIIWLRGVDQVKSFIEAVRYEEGLLVNHGNVHVYVPKPGRVHYRDLYRALRDLEMDVESEDEGFKIGQIPREGEEEGEEDFEPRILSFPF